MVFTEDVVYLGLHLPPLTEHDPRLDVTHPWDVSWEEVACHVIEAHHRNRQQDCLIAGVTFGFRKVGVEVTRD